MAELKADASEAGICLTFDDWFVRGWWLARDIFRAHDARATFFIAKPHELSPRQVHRLRALQDEGHEIGCHTLTHARLPKFMAALRNHPDRGRAYLEAEVLPALEILRGHGFEVTSFSYPYFKHRPWLTGLLLQHFRMVRDAGPPPVAAHALLPARNNAVVPTMGMLDCTGLGLTPDYYAERFDLIARHGGYGVFCGHAIAPDSPKNLGMRVSRADLEAVLGAARERGLALRPMREIGHAPWAHQALAQGA